MIRIATRIIIAAELLLAATSAASADPFTIGAAIFSLFGADLVAGTAIAYVVTAVVGLAEVVGLSYLAKALAPTPAATPPGGTTGKLQAGGAITRSIVVGRGMTAGSLAYANTYSPTQVAAASAAVAAAAGHGDTSWGFLSAFYGPLGAQGNTPNAYLVQVIALSDIPVTGLVGILVNGVEVTWNPFLIPCFEGIAIPEYNSNNAVESYGGSIPATGPYTFSIFGTPYTDVFTSSKSVQDTTTNVTMIQVAPGQELPDTYSFNVSTLTYTFNAANASHSIIVYFNYASATGGTDYLWVKFYDGTQVAADTGLVALYGSDPYRPYTSARVGAGVAYAVVTALTNQNLFSGFPQVKFVLDGVKLYDRRYDTSVGGSGSQRWATPSTWAVTGNPVVIAENILRGISYGGQWVYGAQTVTATQLPSASWTAAASECDSPIDLVAGGTELQFYAGGEITFDTEPATALEELLKTCNGRLAEIGGAYKIRAGAAGSAVFSFSDADILSTVQQTFDPFPSLGQTINAVTAQYTSPAEAWNTKDAAPLYDSTLEALDGGARLPVAVTYGFVTSGTAVQRLMKSERDNQRAFRRHALPMPPDAFVLEPLDVVSWTSARNGYSSKLFEIITADDLPNLNMGLALKELDPNAYDWVAATDEVAVVDGTIAILRPPPQPIVDWSAIPYTLVAGGAIRAAIELGWDSHTDDVDGIGFEIRLTATSATVYASSFHDSMMFAAGSIIISQNLIPNTAYQARGRYLPISVRDTEWSAWLDVTTPNVPAIGLIDIPLEVTTEFNLINAQIQSVKDVIASVARLDAQTFVDQLTVKAVTVDRIAAVKTLLAGDIATVTDTINLVNAVITDPLTGLATRASASDVITLQTLTGDGTHGNVALASRATSLEATVNNGTTGVAATYSDVVTLAALTGDATHGNMALATRSTNLEATVNNGTTGIAATYSDVITLQSLTSDATHGNTALASRATSLEATVNNGTTGVTALYNDTVTLQSLTGDPTHGNLAIANRTTNLEAKVNDGTIGVQALYNDTINLQSITGDGTHGNVALASRSTRLEATVNDGTSGVTALYNEQVALVATTGDATYGNMALGTRTTNLETSVNDPTTGLVSKASVSQISDAESYADSAVASYNIGVSASLNDKASTASVSTVATAAALINGKLAASYQISLAAGGIASLTGYAGNDSAGWVFDGNYFKFSFPGATGGAPVDVLAISNVSGTPKIVFKADMIGDGTLSMNKIAADSVVTNVLRSPSGLMVVDMANGKITINDGA